jgi:hypothetical protein
MDFVFYISFNEHEKMITVKELMNCFEKHSRK